MIRRPLFLALALNLALLSLYLWALQDSLPVTIRLEGARATASVGNGRLTMEDERYTSGGVALTLRDFRSYRAYVPGGRWAWLGDLVWQSNLPSAWRSLKVSALPGGGALLERNHGLRGYRPAGRGFSPVEGRAWTDNLVEARLGRGKEEAALLVRASDSYDGYLFWFRPEHGDMGWVVYQDGQRGEGLTWGTFRLPWPTGLKAVLRDLLWTYFYALALLGLFLLAALPLGLLLRRARLPIPNLRLSPLFLALPMACLGFLAALAVARALLGGIPHVQDSVAYLFQAKTFALGRLSVPSPPLPEFFEHEFVFNDGARWFSKYAPGHALVLALGVLAGAPWLVGPVLGGVSLFLVFLLGKEAYGARTGLLAVFLGLTSPFFLFLSGSYMAHTSGLFFALLFFLFSFKALGPELKQRAWPWALGAGLAWGFLFQVRGLTALGLALPIVLYGGSQLLREPRSWPRYAYLGLGAAVPVLFLLFYNWHLTGDPLKSTYELWGPNDRLGFGQYIGIGGHSLSTGLTNTWRNLTMLQVHLFGWPVYLTLALAFLPFVTGKASRRDLFFLTAFLSLAGAYVFYWADGIMYGPRYYYEALPALLFLTARGLAVLVELARPWAGRGVGLGLAALLLLGLVAYNLTSYLPGQVVVYKDYNGINPQPLRAVRAAGLKNALVFVDDEPRWHWWRYGAVFPQNSPLLNSSVVYARDLEKRNQELMALYPGRSYYLWRDGRLKALSGGGE